MEIELLKLIWTAVSLSLFPIVIWYFVTLKKVIEILKNKHHDTWASLGEIGFIQNNNITNSNKLVMFILNKKYINLKDDELNKNAEQCRILLIIGLTLAVLAFVMPILIGKYS